MYNDFKILTRDELFFNNFHQTKASLVCGRLSWAHKSYQGSLMMVINVRGKMTSTG